MAVGSEAAIRADVAMPNQGHEHGLNLRVNRPLLVSLSVAPLAMTGKKRCRSLKALAVACAIANKDARLSISIRSADPVAGFRPQAVQSSMGGTS